jgi:hypothetical protein
MTNCAETCSNNVFNIHINLTLCILLVQQTKWIYKNLTKWTPLKIRAIIFVYLFVVFFCSFPLNTQRANHFLSLAYCRFDLCQQILTAAWIHSAFQGQVSCTQSRLISYTDKTHGNWYICANYFRLMTCTRGNNYLYSEMYIGTAGHAVEQLVEALHYKSEGCGLDSGWCH